MGRIQAGAEAVCMHVANVSAGTYLGYLNIYLQILLQTKYMAMVFSDGGGPFQQDNAPCHTAKIVQEWFEDQEKEFKVLTWPSYSPDLIPIDHLWDVLDKQVRSMEAPPHNLQDFKDLLLTSWCQIPQDTFRGLVECMH